MIYIVSFLGGGCSLGRYDDNIRFVKTELLPLLEAERSQTAEKYGPDWQVGVFSKRLGDEERQ